MARFLVLIHVLVFVQVQQVWSLLKTSSTHLLSSKAFFESPDLHEAVTDTLAAFGRCDRDALHAYVVAGFKNTTGGAQDFSPDLTWQQKVEILSLVKSLRNLSLHSPNRRLLDASAGELVVHTYQSFDGDGTPGTGRLGSDGTRSVSEVTLRQGPSGISFTVGPVVAGVYLIKGEMAIMHRDRNHVSGTIKAGFVNLRSTLSGTWRAEGADLNSTLHIHLTEMGFDENWTWSPQL
mmetsp:Transcript_66678/g.168141  ORF Transcript_66678/g.168141 Transcript_66678/m.168141 type:complete len:235 (+) Transcript_66678:80-784(+)